MGTETLKGHEMHLSNGANFFRCALQVNPHHYAQTYRGKKGGAGDEMSYVDALLKKAKELDIRVLAITDHNHVGSVQTIRDAAEESGVCVFPGFEITSQEGIHILCLYDLDTPVANLERNLGSLGVRWQRSSA